MQKSIFILFLFFFSGFIYAQHVPVPTPAQTQAVVIKGATIHLGNGQVIENGAIAFSEGKITAVNKATDRQAYPNHQEVDATGKHIYPGFIAPSCNLGLTEIGAVRATRDFSEVGTMNPNVRSLIAYNTDSEIPPTVRSMGVLIAQVTPQSGRISGTSSIVQLDAWNWEDAAYKVDDGVHLNWPGRLSYSWRARSVSINDRYDEQVKGVEDFFKEAAAYAKDGDVETINLKFEAMKGLWDGSKKLYIHTNGAAEIQSSVLMAKRFGATPVIVGGRDSWMVTDFLKEQDVAVVLQDVHSLPRRQDADVDQPFKTAAQLQEAGVLFCFALPGENWKLRNLGFQAGHAVGFGLSYEDAISALTSNTAKIMGIDDKTGTLEIGKDANLFIAEGDILDMRTAVVSQAYIQGRAIVMDNKQEMLYRKFQKKYQTR